MATRELVCIRLTLDGRARPVSRFVFAPGEVARLRAMVTVANCANCDRRIVGKQVRSTDYFDPWSPVDQIEPDYTDHYCDDCDNRGAPYEGDFSPMYCERCDRDVIQRNPRNGWRSYFTSDPEDPGSDCCVGCAQRFRFAFGHTDAELASGRVPCDFYSYDELARAGFEEAERFSGRALVASGGREWADYCALVKLAGGIVLTDQGPTGLGDYPDYVAVYVRIP